MEDTKRPIFGAEAERIGTRLDEATDEFLKENGGTGERSELAIQKRVKHDEELGGKIMVKPIFDDETNFSWWQVVKHWDFNTWRNTCDLSIND